MLILCLSGTREVLDIGDLVWKRFSALSWSDQAKLRDESNMKKARKIAAENLLSVLNDSVRVFYIFDSSLLTM
jgi:hypothetical protein